MRRFFSILIICLLTLSSCSKIQTQTYTCQPFSSEIEIQKDNFSLEGKLNLSSPDYIELEITKPENIKGCIIKKDGEKISVIKNDYDIDINSQKNLTGKENIYENLFEILSTLSSNSYNIDSKENPQIGGTYAYGNFTAVIDSTDKSLVCVKSENFICNFLYN